MNSIEYPASIPAPLMPFEATPEQPVSTRGRPARVKASVAGLGLLAASLAGCDAVETKFGEPNSEAIAVTIPANEPIYDRPNFKTQCATVTKKETNIPRRILVDPEAPIIIWYAFSPGQLEMKGTCETYGWVNLG